MIGTMMLHPGAGLTDGANRLLGQQLGAWPEETYDPTNVYFTEQQVRSIVVNTGLVHVTGEEAV